MRGLPSFPAADKRKDPRYKWFVANHGDRCWELDAMDPNDLRDCVEQEIRRLIEPVAWATLRGRQQGRAGVAANHPVEVEGAMTITFDSLRAKFEPMGTLPQRIHG